MENRDNRDNDNLSRKDQPKDASETSREVASRRQQQGDSQWTSARRSPSPGITASPTPDNRNRATLEETSGRTKIEPRSRMNHAPGVKSS